MAKKGSTPWNKNKSNGWTNKKGYKCIKVDGREKKVHRLIMENKLGRPLLATEDVHHLNCIKDDNREENLIVIDHSKHTIVTNSERVYRSGYKMVLTEIERKRRSDKMKQYHIKNRLNKINHE